MRLSSWSPKYYTLKRTKRNNSYGPRNFCRKTSPLKTRESTKKWCSHHEISQYKQTVKNVIVLKRGRVLCPATFKHLTKIMAKKLKCEVGQWNKLNWNKSYTNFLSFRNTLKHTAQKTQSVDATNLFLISALFVHHYKEAVHKLHS